MYITTGLHRALARTPDNPAYLFEGRATTWAQCADRVARGAAVLRTLGLSAGDRVAVLSDNTPAYYELLLAAPWAGVILAGLNNRWSPTELAAALDDADADVLVVDLRAVPLARQLLSLRPSLRHVVFADTGETPDGFLDWEHLLVQTTPIPDLRRGGDEVLYLFYTSGTTGAPKGVMLTAANVVCAALMTIGEFGWSDANVFLCCTPLFHVGGSAPCLAQITQGSIVSLMRRFDPAAIPAVIERDRVTQTQLVPTMMRLVIDDPAIGAFDLSSMRKITYGAAPMSPTLIEQALQVFPNVQFQQGYALTESAALGTSLRPEHHKRGDADQQWLKSVGGAVPGVELRIADADGRSLEAGQTGEILIASPAVMAGYWRRPEETAKALRNGWLHTGDVGYLDRCGFLFLVDRLKDMIITGGENVYSIEVENAFYRHPAVGECAAIGLPDPRWGEVVTLVVHLRLGFSAAESELFAVARQSIGGYKVPHRIVFLGDPLPKNSSGKISKPALIKRYING